MANANKVSADQAKAKQTEAKRDKTHDGIARKKVTTTTSVGMDTPTSGSIKKTLP